MPYTIISWVAITLLLTAMAGIIINRRNLIVMLMALELMLLAINICFLAFAVIMDDFMGQVFALFILTVAAADSAVGLAMLVIYFRVRETIELPRIKGILKG